MHWNKPIDQVTLEDLNQLVEDETMENQHLEFKRALPEKVGNDAGKKEFIKDVLSFANADGGTLLYGVVEKEDHKPSLSGMDGISVDPLRQQLADIIKWNVEPRLDGVVFHFIALDEEGKMVLLIDVPKSWNAPHGYKINHGTYRYYIRANAANIPMDALQIREHTLTNHRIRERVQDFNTGRLIELASGHAPISLHRSSKLIIHVVPLSAFREYKALDIQRLYKEGAEFYHAETRLNLDGYLLYYGDAMMKSGTYTQIYRNGIIEHVDTKITKERKLYEVPYLPSEVLVRDVKKIIDKSFQFYRKNNIQPPIYVFVTLQDVKGYCLPTPEYLKFNFEELGPPFDQHTLQLPEVLVEDLSTPTLSILKTPMDALWNASGFPYCPNTKTADTKESPQP